MPSNMKFYICLFKALHILTAISSDVSYYKNTLFCLTIFINSRITTTKKMTILETIIFLNCRSTENELVIPVV